ncbi:MAG: fumarylacetoacetate hydrolase family protein [Ktedonobacterales bacterium]
MRLATFRDAVGVQLGVVRGEGIVHLPRAAARTGQSGATADDATLRDMLALIDAGPAALAHVRELADTAPAGAMLPLSSVTLLAPIPRPRRNIFCIGRNYAEHAAESLRAQGQQAPAGAPRPNFFTKATTTVSGPYDDIPFDASVSAQMDWEVELGVIVGRSGRHIAKEQALEHVWGYLVLNDVSARDLQHAPGVQWFLGKSLDGSCPTGPWIVTADELPNPQTLRLSLRVNGELKQDDTTAHMIFDVATQIAALSHSLTLEAGDMLATGTPSGVGFARTPPEFLAPGDVMESAIEGISALRNRVVDVKGQG